MTSPHQPTRTASSAEASPRVPAAGLILPTPWTTPAADGNGYMVARMYEAHVVPAHCLTILAGFVFDGASIPRSCWSILGLHPMHPRVMAAALIHDALYGGELCPRHVADAVFRLCLRADGVDGFRAWLMFRAVRIGGGFVWRKHTPDGIAHARMYCSLTPCFYG